MNTKLKTDAIVSIVGLLAGIFVQAVCLCGTADQKKVSVITDKETTDAIKLRIDKLQKKRKTTINEAFAQAKKMEVLIKKLNMAEISMGGINGLGAVEQMRVKAERYGLEMVARKKIQQEVLALNALLYQWKNLSIKITTDTELLALKETIMKLKAVNKEEQPLTSNVSEENFEYYQVTKTATVKAVSALPDVYGNSSLWKYIYEANRKKIKGPEVPISKGTLLIIPNVKPNVNDLKLETE